MGMRSALNWALVGLTVLYPLVVYATIGRVAPQWLALLIVVLAVGRALIAQQKFWWLAAAGAAALGLAAWLGNDPLMVKLYPVWVNAVLLAVFGYSLLHPPSVVERLARLQEPALPASGVRYTRKVTLVWCLFFVLNGAVAAITALWGSDAVWAFYNGLLAYLLMGCLMGGEWLVRRHVRQPAPGM
ncbi:hypothetical protein [uncultured Comamonas sp.]|uniref:COG4648 family protein n=1 Tax=uncultured Comamonas sp. TaxID=114710 RepID=UPI003747C974